VSLLGGWVTFFALVLGLIWFMNTHGPDTSSGQDFEAASYEEEYVPESLYRNPEPCVTCELEDRIADLERRSMTDD
jgi:hypothetical protein